MPGENLGQGFVEIVPDLTKFDALLQQKVTASLRAI